MQKDEIQVNLNKLVLDMRKHLGKTGHEPNITKYICIGSFLGKSYNEIQNGCVIKEYVMTLCEKASSILHALHQHNKNENEHSNTNSE